MDHSRWYYIKYFFVAALEQRSEDRSRFLAQRCHDPHVRTEVERLLAAHEASADFLEGSAIDEFDAAIDTADAATLKPGAELGPYTILELLGAGAMGEVYRAHDARLQRDVAVKILPAEMVSSRERASRFRREARAAAALSHPNICTIHEFGEAAGHLYIAMEFVRGETLRKRLERTRPSLEEVMSIGVQLADALEEARRRGVVHRDIKPANIVLTTGGTPKLLDFGLAKHRTIGTTSVLTDPGTILGTVAYMAPEQARGSLADHRSDLYSFGVVLYELLSGRRPFEGPSDGDVLQQVIRSSPPPIQQFNPAAPERAVRIVTKLLAKDPGSRYQRAHDVWTELQAITRSAS